MGDDIFFVFSIFFSKKSSIISNCTNTSEDNLFWSIILQYSKYQKDVKHL